LRSTGTSRPAKARQSEMAAHALQQHTSNQLSQRGMRA
jgi:hypothetical protein